MKKAILFLLLLFLVLPALSEKSISFSLDGDVTDVFMNDIDGDGKQDFLFGTWNHIENPSLLYWWQSYWERGMVYFFSGDKRIFKYPTGAHVNSVTTVNFGERLIAAGTTLLEGMPSGYVLFFDLKGERRGTFKTDGKVEKIYPLFGGSRLLILNSRELEHETQFLVLGKDGIERSFVLPDLIEEVLQTDLENDGRPELLAGSVFDQDIPHYVYLFDSNFSEILRMETDDVTESIDASDVNGDGMKEIIVGTYNYVYAFKKDGSLVWRYELPIGPVFVVKSFNTSDGSNKIIFTSQKELYILNSKGEITSKKELPFYGFCLFNADWDQDGKKEIIVGDGKDFLVWEESDILGSETTPTPPPLVTPQPPQTTTLPQTTLPPQTTSPPTTQPPQTTLFPAVIKICGVNPVAEVIDLCNNGVAPIDIGGWTLSDKSGSYMIPPGTIILSSGSWTVDINAYNPTRNTKGLYLDDENDFLELRDKNGNLIDKRTWGTPIIYLI